MKKIICFSLLLIVTLAINDTMELPGKIQTSNLTIIIGPKEEVISSNLQSTIDGNKFHIPNNVTITIPKNHQFINVTYKSSSQPFGLNYNLTSSNQKVLFHIASDIHSSNLTYSEIGYIEVTVSKVEHFFMIVFDCVQNGNHELTLTLQHGSETKITQSIIKQCARISNDDLYINLINVEQQQKTKNIAVIQNSTYKQTESQYQASCGQFDLYINTQTDSQLLVVPTIRQIRQSTEQTAEFRGNDKLGGLISLKRKLDINILFNCSNISEVEYHVSFNSSIFESPVVFTILKFCKIDQVERQILNFTQFPIVIGTIQGQSDVYRPGQVQSSYNNSTQIRQIAEEEDAEVFHISMKDQLDELFKKDLKMGNPILEYDKHILNIAKDIPNFNQQDWNKPFDILLIFKCLKAGKSMVKMELDFYFGCHKNQTIPIFFTKICGEVVEEDTSEYNFLASLLYYIACFFGITFGLFIIRLFKNMMQKEFPKQDFNTIDTSYKRKYDRMQELPVTSTTIVLQE